MKTTKSQVVNKNREVQHKHAVYIIARSIRLQDISSESN